MGKTTRVVLYGNSLFLSAIGSSLSRYSELELVKIDALLPGSTEQLDALVTPDAVIIDMFSASFDFSRMFLEAHPGTRMISFDFKNAKTRVLSCQEFPALQTDDLVRLIQSQDFCV